MWTLGLTVGETLVKNGVLTHAELSELKKLAEDAANKMRALDKLSGRDIAKAMKLTKQEIVLTRADDSGVIDLDEENDDQPLETSFNMETDWENNDTGKAVEDAIEAQLKLSEALSKFNDKLATSRKVDAALQDQFTEAKSIPRLRSPTSQVPGLSAAVSRLGKSSRYANSLRPTHQ